LKPITNIASRILAAFRKRDQRALRKLNDEVLKATSMECGKVCFDLAVFSYVLSKVVSKPRYLAPEYEPSLREIARVFQAIVEKLDYAEEDELLALFTGLGTAISRLEKKDPRFIVDLVTKGRLKMAATFYAEGMSLGVAAEMTGLDKQEILDYAGETMMFDRLKDEKTIEERVKTARKFLSG
jgi:hypothetical protein